MRVPYWSLSSFYFFYFATLGAILPYWSLYLRHAGFSAHHIGVLNAVLVATKIISPNLLGWLADRTGRGLSLIRWSSAIAALFFAGFFYIAVGFWQFVILTIAFSAFWNATLPQFEAQTLQHLKAVPQRYSQIRLWGSVGFIVAVVGVGQILDEWGMSSLIGVIASLLVANWLVALWVPRAAAAEKTKAGQGVWSILLRSEVILFFLVYLLLQVAHGPYYVFYSVYLKQMGYSTLLTGGLWGLGVAAEIVMFMLARHFLEWFSLRSLLLWALVLSTVRWWLISQLANDLSWLVFAQLLHAATFGLAHLVAIQLLRQYFGPTHSGKGQALYSSIAFGLGSMLGSLYSGFFWDFLGPQAVYVLASLASGFAWLLAFLGVARQKRLA